MPTITLSIMDLTEQVGVPMTMDRLTEALSSVKCEPEAANDREITVEVTSDRPDLFSSEGIARAIRNYLGIGAPYSVKHHEGNPLLIIVDPSTSGVRPLIVAAAIRDAPLTSEVTKQFMQLQEKLHNTFGANRRKASIGVYDLDTLTPPFTYSAELPDDISFVPLDCAEKMSGREILQMTAKGLDYASILLSMDRYPLLTDSYGSVLSMPPIINSEETRVTENTRNLLIDVTGPDEKSISTCLNMMVTSILERGGALQSVKVEYPDRSSLTPRLDMQVCALSPSTVNSVSGLGLSQGEVVSLLGRMGLDASSDSQGVLAVRVPPYRVDIIHEIDLVEDVIMAYGLNRMPTEVPRIATTGRHAEGSRLRSRVRDLMVGMGFQEIATYVLSSREIMEEKSLMGRRQLVEIQKPVSSEYTVLRDSLMPKLLQFLGSNTHHTYPQRVFEYGSVVRYLGGHPVNASCLSAAISDHRVSFEEMQAVAVALFRNLSKEVRFSAHSCPTLIGGRTAKMTVDGEAIGTVGEVSPQVLVNFGMSCPVLAMEVDTSGLVLLESLFRG